MNWLKFKIILLILIWIYSQSCTKENRQSHQEGCHQESRRQEGHQESHQEGCPKDQEASQESRQEDRQEVSVLKNDNIIT